MIKKTGQTKTQVSEKKRKLGQYRRLMREIRHDRLRLARLGGRLTRLQTRLLPVQSEALAIGEAALAAYRAGIEANMSRCYELMAEIEAYINRIEDSGIRHIFKLYYIDGFSWQKVAFEIGGYDESWPRKKHDRYLAAEE